MKLSTLLATLVLAFAASNSNSAILVSATEMADPAVGQAEIINVIPQDDLFTVYKYYDNPGDIRVDFTVDGIGSVILNELIENNTAFDWTGFQWEILSQTAGAVATFNPSQPGVFGSGVNTGSVYTTTFPIPGVVSGSSLDPVLMIDISNLGQGQEGTFSVLQRPITATVPVPGTLLLVLLGGLFLARRT